MALRVAIAASAVRTALHDDLPTLWSNVAAGSSAIAPVEGFDRKGLSHAQAAQIWKQPDDAEDDPALRILGPHGRLLEAVARHAYAAGALSALPPERVGLFVGMGMVDSPIHDLVPAALASRADGAPMDLGTFFASGYRSIHPLWPLSMLNNVAAGQVSIDLNLRGDNLVLASDADAGLRALLEAARSVQRGDCDAALAGGVSGRVTPFTFRRLKEQGRTAVIPGEGGAILTLARDGAGPAIIGGSSAFGGDPACWTRAIQLALDEAGSPRVDLVFRHAEGEPDVDASEQDALAALGLGDVRSLTSKTCLGHTGAAAATLDVALATQALRTEGTRALILARGPEGGVGALVLEAA